MNQRRTATAFIFSASLALAVSLPCRAQDRVDPIYEAHLSAVESLLESAQQLFGESRWDESLPLLLEALSQSEKHLGEGPFTDLVLVNLGLNYAALGRNLEARQTYLRALAIEERLYASDSPSRLGLLINFGRLYLNADEPESALPLLERANGLCAVVCKANDERGPFIRQSLESTYRALGRTEDADAIAEGR